MFSRLLFALILTFSTAPAVAASFPASVDRSYFDGKSYVLLLPRGAIENAFRNGTFGMTEKLFFPVKVIIGNKESFSVYDGEETMNMNFSSQISVKNGPQIFLYRKDRVSYWMAKEKSRRMRTLESISEIPPGDLAQLEIVLSKLPAASCEGALKVVKEESDGE